MVLLWEQAAWQGSDVLGQPGASGTEVVLTCSTVRMVDICRSGLRAPVAVS